MSRPVRLVGVGPCSGVVLLVFGRLGRGTGSVILKVVISEWVLLRIGGRGVRGVSCWVEVIGVGSGESGRSVYGWVRRVGVRLPNRPR